MKCCCCGNTFRGVKNKTDNSTREEGKCPKCGQSVGEYRFVSVYGRKVVSRCVNIGERK